MENLIRIENQTRFLLINVKNIQHKLIVELIKIL